MLDLKDLFYKWVPVYLRLPVMLIMFFSTLVCNGVFSGNITDMYSSHGNYMEPYTAAYNAMYIGMGIGVMIYYRIKLRFAAKSLLLFGLSMMLLMNIICATSENTTLVIVACLVLGMTKIAAMMELYLMWLLIWSKNFDTSKLYPFVYFLALSGLYFMTWLTTRLAYIYNWHYAYIVVFVLLLICILFTLIFVEYHPVKKKLPLYQMDWIGVVLLIINLLLFNYVVVYGKVEDWFSSPKIVAAIFGTAISLLLFIRRELIFKRPVFNFDFFRLPNFRMGLLYFVLMGIFIPSTFQSAFTASILHYEAYRNTELTLYMIPGVLLGAIFCYYWYDKKHDGEILVMLGFVMMVVYHIILYKSFGNTFTINDFWIPSLIKGLAMSLLYIAVGLYIAKNFKLKDVLSVSGMAIVVRSFLGSGSFAAIFSYFLYSQRIRHLNYLAGLTDSNNNLPHQPEIAANLYQRLQAQAILSASKEFSGYIIISGIIIVFALLLKYIVTRLKKVSLSVDL
jgi:DHA2 family multidrug resistance protein